jgi:hypothetical protein
MENGKWKMRLVYFHLKAKLLKRRPIEGKPALI